MTAVVAPKIAQHYARGEIASLQKLIRRASQVITITMLPVFFIFCFAGAQLVPLVFGEQYTNSYAPMMILAASQLMVAALGLSGPLLSMCGHEKKISKTIWASTVINIVLNALLIPIWHENGAAVATAITSMCWTSYLAWFALKQMNILVSPIGIRHEVKVNSGGSHGAR
jgi:O-antigen/teichoic acid export membrane protein